MTSESLIADRPEDIRVTIEFEVPEADRDKLDKLIAYARRLGIVQYALDSFDASEGSRR